MIKTIGYYELGIKVMKRKRIIINYLTGWFIFDIIASFPYQYTLELIFTTNPDSSMNSLSVAPKLLRMIKIVKFLRILRLLRVLKLKRVLYKIDEYLITDQLSALFDGLKLLAVILLINHMMACIFYYIGTFDNKYDPHNWINASGLGGYSNIDTYIMTFYWAFTTMAGVGYGDIVPQSSSEKLF